MQLTPPERRIEVWRCTDLLPPVNLDQIQIFARKTVLIEGCDVNVRSALSSIQDTTLRTGEYIFHSLVGRKMDNSGVSTFFYMDPSNGSSQPLIKSNLVVLPKSFG
jgi:hypothetical protein